MIITCDLDGTLTDGSGVISAENAAGLRSARQRGAACVLATSRPSRCLDLPAWQLDLFDCVITCDGAEQAVPGPARVRTPLPPGIVLRAARALEDARLPGAYAVEFGTALGHEEGYAGWPATDIGAPAHLGPLRELCGRGPLARIFFRPADGDEDTLRAAADAMRSELGDAIAGTIERQPESAGLVRFASRGATKGDALRAWLAEAGRARPLIVFGDQLNDLSMLELADEAFAVGDAHPLLRERYPHLPDDDGSAVARAILRMSGALAPADTVSGNRR